MQVANLDYCDKQATAPAKRFPGPFYETETSYIMIFP